MLPAQPYRNMPRRLHVHWERAEEGAAITPRASVAKDQNATNGPLWLPIFTFPMAVYTSRP
ncbi:hypothetical protein LMG22037_04069 [Paraburkholderia phenoliruptrix]|uniref:Uncharacterized protein n=1 Tax=Paraburkholderia phenoliruptrix TaxID=252970 RepID=A0A6J5BP22_9BURK|nr:hypothetical protein LMG22037_04069 [Paraburkholderia phenoliruptrix]